MNKNPSTHYVLLGDAPADSEPKQRLCYWFSSWENHVGLKVWVVTAKLHPSLYQQHHSRSSSSLYHHLRRNKLTLIQTNFLKKKQRGTNKSSWKIFQNKCIPFAFKPSVSGAVCQRPPNCLFPPETQCSHAQLYKTNGAISPEVHNYSCDLHRGQKCV